MDLAARNPRYRRGVASHKPIDINSRSEYVVLLWIVRSVSSWGKEKRRKEKSIHPTVWTARCLVHSNNTATVTHQQICTKSWKKFLSQLTSLQCCCPLLYKHMTGQKTKVDVTSLHALGIDPIMIVILRHRECSKIKIYIPRTPLQRLAICPSPRRCS